MKPGELGDILANIARAGLYSRETAPPHIAAIAPATAALHRLSELPPPLLADRLARVIERTPDAERADQLRHTLETAYLVGRLAMARDVYERTLMAEFQRVGYGRTPDG